jgi:cytochrome c biogenesis protein CcmG/thiol:disulfide interchange protein DsbE
MPLDPAPPGKIGRGTQRAVLLGVAVAAVVLVGLAIPSLLAGSHRPPAIDGAARPPQPAPLTARVSSTDKAPLPHTTLTGFGGGPDVPLASYRGRPLVVNLWATWCAPCVEEMPVFQQVATTAGGKVAFLGVNVADTPQRAQSFVEELGITYDLAIDPQQDFAQAIGAYGMPTTLLVDPSGEIVYRHTGPLTAADLHRLLAEHLSVQI